MCPVYFRQQAHFLLYHPCILYGMSKGSSHQYPTKIPSLQNMLLGIIYSGTLWGYYSRLHREFISNIKHIRLTLLLLAAVISLSLLFFVYSSSIWIVTVHNPQCWQVFLLLFFLEHIVSLCHFSSVTPGALSLISISFGLFVCVLPLSILRMVQNILQGELPRCLFLWWDFYSRVWFWEVFLFFWETLNLLFLWFLFVSWCPLPIFPSNCNFHFLYVFRCFLDSIVLFLLLFLFSPFHRLHGIFSMPNSILIS